ncbi:hypothetical protein BKA81DRAFT_349467 [Phyllosticta paracitricarpa]
MPVMPCLPVCLVCLSACQTRHTSVRRLGMSGPATRYMYAGTKSLHVPYPLAPFLPSSAATQIDACIAPTPTPV